MNTDENREGITFKLDGSIGIVFLYFISNTAKNMMLKMKKKYCLDFLSLQAVVTLTKT